MPIKALKFQSGIRRNSTSYANEGSWFSCDKVRFRSGQPEKLGGWQRISAEAYQGTCRLLFPWTTLGQTPYLAVGTNLKFYINSGGEYNDITPIRSSVTLNNPFDTSIGLTTVTVHDTAHGALTDDFVTFSGAAAVGGLDLNNEYQITKVDDDTYTITAASAASSTVTGGGGASVAAAYQVNTGPANAEPVVGWGAGGWGSGTWGVGSTTSTAMQIWNASNFGEDLVFGPRGGTLYYWDSSAGLTTRGVAVSSLGGASDVPTYQNYVLVSDVYRFVLAFGCDPVGGGAQDPMLIRWSDQEDVANWTPSATTKAGELRLSKGSKIVMAVQTRQEVVVFTDTAVYSLQYQGAPVYWGATLLADNTSILSQRAATAANSTVYWMGQGKFYVYDGAVKTLPCDVLNYTFQDLNYEQGDQFNAGTIEQFNEIWWFYCSEDSEDIDRYVVYNYVEGVWFIGSMSRTAWVDAGVFQYPIAAAPDTNNLVYHEFGVDEDVDGTPVGIEAFIESAQFDIDDGDRFSLITKLIPDLTFENSSAASPSVTMSLKPLKESGSGYNSSVGGSGSSSVTRTATVPIEAYTELAYVRVRGRQMVMRVESSALGVMWQLGVPRVLIRSDGRRG